MPQQISHFLQGTVAPLMATVCFVLAADTLGVQLTAMCTPLLSPCNFLRITGEAFTTQGSNAHAGTSFERCRQVQEKFKGGRALFSLISLAVITKVPHHHCGWAQLADPETRFQVNGIFYRTFWARRWHCRDPSRIASTATSERSYQSQQSPGPNFLQSTISWLKFQFTTEANQ